MGNGVPLAYFSPADTRPPRLLFLGGGAVVSKCYLPALDMLGWTSSATVFDASALATENLRSRYPNVHVEQRDLDSTLARLQTGEFDAAIVALPNRLHRTAVLGTLQRGIDVLCEKPLALCTEECIEMGRVAREAERVLAVGMVRRLHASVLALQRALADGLVGRLTSIDVEDGSPYAWLADTSAVFDARNGGVLADMGVHYLDLAQAIVGPMEMLAYHDDWAGGVEANATINLRSGAGVPVHVAVSRTHALRNTLIFQGESGRLILEKDNFATCFLESDSGLRSQLSVAAPFACAAWPHTFETGFAQQLLNFARSVSGQAAPYVSAEVAAETIGIISRAYGSRSSNPSPKREAGRPTLPPSMVVVTGATGFIGTNLVGRLAELGCTSTRAPVRSYRSAAPVARFRVDLQRTDLLDMQAIERVVADARFVFHLAYGRDGGDARRVTVEGTRNVVEAAIAAGAEAVVVLSTMYVFGRPETSESVNETWPYSSVGGEYGATKAEMEKWCLERAHSSGGTRIVVLNPSCVYGPWGKTYTTMPATMAELGSFCWIDEGSGIANYAYVDNVVDAILLAARKQAAHGERFIINDGSVAWRDFLSPLLGPHASHLPSYAAEDLARMDRAERATVRDIARILAQDRQLRAAVLSWPWAQSVARVAKSRAPNLAERLRGTGQTGTEVRTRPDLRPPPAWLAELFAPTRTRFSSEKARNVLGWEPRIDLGEGHRRTVEYLRETRLVP